MRAARTALALALWLPLLLSSCAPSQPPPRPMLTATPGTAPEPSPSPAASPLPASEMNEDTAEVSDAFLADVVGLVEQALFLSSLPCDELSSVAQATPAEISGLRGFSGTLKRLSEQEPALDTPAVQAGIADLDVAMGQLEGALTLCNIELR